MIFHDQKLEKILELLEVQPYWTSKQLAERFGTSRSTIQRCLGELHERGLAERIHGGIKRKSRNLFLPIAVASRITEDAQAKELIAQEACKLLPDSGYVYIDGGTTMLPLAAVISRNPPRQLSFVTNDVAIAGILAERGVRHMLLGGKFHPVTQTLSGPVSQEQISRYNFALCFISVNGIDKTQNTTCSVGEEAILKRAAMGQSAVKVLLAAASKWGNKAGAVVAQLNDFDKWICDKSNREMQRICRAHQVELRIAR